tara:strand:- start:44 stop:259 length:216 start_codon:yes stop_codon:yes gene_type:complete
MLKIKYVLCFVANKMLKTDDGNTYAFTYTFEESDAFDSKFEALEEIQKRGNTKMAQSMKYEYAILEIITFK